VIEFKPPISSRETDELIAIVNDSTDSWQHEAIDQANEELAKRNISREYQIRVLKKWDKQAKKLDYIYQNRIKLNEHEGYSLIKMVCIFFLTPAILLRRWNFDMSLRELREENFKKKYNQRLSMLLFGSIFYILWILSSANYIDEQRQAEIDSVDISKWEQNYYGHDSLKQLDSTIKSNK
jgi:HD-like signal output (HDOD) protein